jgi:hypothetical protein
MNTINSPLRHGMVTDTQGVLMRRLKIQSSPMETPQSKYGFDWILADGLSVVVRTGALHKAEIAPNSAAL